MTGSGLPPRPEPVTGLPRPPRAPHVAGPWQGYDRRFVRGESDHPGRKQGWFETIGPILEIARAKRRNMFEVTAGYPALIVILGPLVPCLLYLAANASDSHFNLKGQVSVLGVIFGITFAALMALFFLIYRTHVVYAGAVWISCGETEDDSVTIYDLDRIDVTDIDGRHPILHLTGANHVRLRLPMGLVEGNPALWDLLYNGLIHSAAAGAETDDATRDLLRLPRPHSRAGDHT